MCTFDRRGRGRSGDRRRPPLDRALRFAAGMLIAAASAAHAQPNPTFNKEIASIVWTRCASCHRPGAIGPFSLLTYDDVRRHAPQIDVVIARGVMPPWKPAASGV